MSLLTDKDFLLHSLHLSYLRRVLPSHAPSTALAGHSPYNLLSFPSSSDLAAASPYLALSSALLDEEKFPELTTGRNSPPLALQLGRGGSSTAGGAGASGTEEAPGGGRKKRGGTGALGYTQTIVGKGSGVVSGGMRVQSGKSRTWKGKGKLSAASVGEDGAEEGDGADLQRRRSQEPFLHSHQSNGHPSSSFPSAQQPPNVVVHSPVLTPAGSPPPSSMPGPSFSDLTDARPRSNGISAEPSGADLSGSPSSPARQPPQRARFTASPPAISSPPRQYSTSSFPEPDPTCPSSPASPSDFPSRPLSSIALPSQPSSSLPVTSSSLTASSPISTLSSPSGSPSPAITPALGVSASVASSGVSLYGASSRFTPAGGLGAVDESDGESLAAVPPSCVPQPPRAPASELAEEKMEEAPTQEVPTFALPPGLRVRERRRVNFRPGELMLNLNPPAPPPPVEEKQAVEALSPPPPAQPAPPPPAPAQPTQQLAPPPATDPTTTSSSSMTVPPRSRRSSSSSSFGGGGRGSPRHQPLVFPPRSVYLQQQQLSSSSSSLLPSSPPTTAPPQPSKSALSALFAPSPSSSSTSSGAGGGAEENPFTRLYASIISRTAPPPPPGPARRRRGPVPTGAGGATDVLSLKLFFPNSKEKKPLLLPLKAGLSAPITVEEVLGAGLLMYVEQGREPPLYEVAGEGDGGGGREEWMRRAREGEETARWELRIVEDEEGEVDDDFPALDRTRAITAFAFTEFAIVRASPGQVADNLLKQSTLTRRPSRILQTHSAPVPSSAPTPSSSSPSAATAPLEQQQQPKQEVVLRVRIPEGLRVRDGKEEEDKVEVNVEGGMLLSQVLDLILSLLTPISPLPSHPTPPPLRSRDFSLLLRLSDSDLILPLSQTVAGANLASSSSSAGNVGKGAGPAAGREVVLVEKSRVGGVGIGLGAQGGGSRRARREREDEGDEDLFPLPAPGALSSSRRRSGTTTRQQLDEQQQQRQLNTSTASGAPGYQHYNVLRKLPMSLGGRHPRTIAIDGDYLHFMPPDPRLGHFPSHALPLHQADTSSGRTTSLHISSLHSCKVSRRSASSFKIVVHTPKGIDKRYDFEAASAEEAREIVEAIGRVREEYGHGDGGEEGRRRGMGVGREAGRR
ncbi:hypothetical protein JCM8547_000608 [Rhodosporidiobolus lusitaniae]